ncbi:MAG: TRAP transporter small permease subunit [Filomicrobium sp.]
MQRYIEAVDKLSTWVGHAFAWCIMVMMLGTCYEVFVRYVLRDPTAWAFDISYMMYGTLFMMGGAYALARDSHVRGDVFFRTWSPKTQARLELFLYFIFFFPGVIALVLAGWKFSERSFRWGEVSSMSPANVPIWQFKLIIPAAGALLFLQGTAQVCRCLICIKTGKWPDKLDDVEELETVLKHQAEDHEQLQHDLQDNKGATGK